MEAANEVIVTATILDKKTVDKIIKIIKKCIRQLSLVFLSYLKRYAPTGERGH